MTSFVFVGSFVLNSESTSWNENFVLSQLVLYSTVKIQGCLKLAISCCLVGDFELTTA